MGSDNEECWCRMFRFSAFGHQSLLFLGAWSACGNGHLASVAMDTLLFRLSVLNRLREEPGLERPDVRGFLRCVCRQCCRPMQSDGGVRSQLSQPHDCSIMDWDSSNR